MATEFEIVEFLRTMFPDIGDDAAIFELKEKGIVSVDTFIESVHFPTMGTSIFSLHDIGYRTTVATLSDIAAMGGRALYLLVSVGVKKGDRTWFKELYDGVQQVLNMASIAQGVEVKVVGGDITYSKNLTISMTVIGEAATPITRGGAQPGDKIGVTGELGRIKLAWYTLKQGGVLPDWLRIKLLQPQLRLKEGLTLCHHVHAMIDISDGLLLDLSHILRMSGNLGAVINLGKLPILDDVREWCEKQGLNPIEYALSSGEEFELLFTYPPEVEEQINVGFTPIGEIIHKPGIYDNQGHKLTPMGWDHFARRTNPPNTLPTRLGIVY